jgi:hypothetical protein
VVGAALAATLAIGGAGSSASAAPPSCPVETDTTTEGWICELYLTLLERSPGGDELAHWVSVAEVQSLRSVEHGITYSDERLEAFVDRTFQEILHRPVDQDGRIFWREGLRGGAQERIFPGTSSFRFSTDLEMERALFLSAEGSALGYGDPATIVDALYDLYLERPGDAGGRAFWIDRLATGALTREQVIAAFAQSRERGAIGAARLYELIRPPDPAGFELWTEVVRHDGWLLAEFDFLGTPEVVSRFGAAGICAAGGPCP